ncbi:multidrug effflux MFS transporter [Salinicola halophilus]|uniref:multidrug effflux MFS transporter n=1 Tax=Salinicola halophilus TaxID=184065 RepID=UPI001955115F|nr:multidrug effflux MFS transporter [Salinicola halophilus]
MPRHRTAPDTPSRSYPATLPLVLAMTMALGPLAIDAYLPAFPQMARELGVGVSEVSRSLSIYIFALALGQLVGGPLSDQWGRSRLMIAGLAIFALASLAITQVTSLPALLALRAVQAFGSGWVMVLIPALVRDRVHGQEAAKLFSMIGLIMVVAPGVAPSLGTALLALSGWHGIFAFLAVYALCLIPLQARVVLRASAIGGQAGAARPAADGESTLLTRYRAVLTTRPALAHLALQAFAFSVMMLFITHASFIYQSHFGRSESSFSLLFGANIVMMLVVNLTNRALLNRFASRQILVACLCLQFTGVLLLCLATALDVSIWLFLPAMMLTIGAQGGIVPNNQACYMEFFSRHGGTAASLLGATQFGIAGGLSALSTLLPETLGYVIAAMFACSLTCIAVVILALRPGRRSE